MESIKEEITSTIENSIEKVKTSKDKVIKLAIAVVAAILVVIIGITVACNMFSAEYVAKKSVMASFKGNYKAYFRHSLLSAEEYMYSYARDEEENLEEFLDDEGYDSVKEMLEDNSEEFLDDLEDELGEYKIEIKRVKADHYTRKELKSLKEDLGEEFGDYINEEKISDAAKVEVKVRIVGEDDRDTDKYSIRLVKYKGFWKTANPIFLDY